MVALRMCQLEERGVLQLRRAPERPPWRLPQNHFFAMQVLREQLNRSALAVLNLRNA